MPAVSKDQQRSAAIALKARKGGTVDKLPKKSASKSMADSMTIKELEKFASTKHKGFPEKKNEAPMWAGMKLSEALELDLDETLVLDLDEEMIGVSDQDKPEEQIVTQKSKKDRLDDKEIANGKEAEDAWPYVTNGSTPALASSSQGAMAGNTTGARVAESSTRGKRLMEGAVRRWQKLAKIK